jgi:hypothetical protein
MDTLRSYSGASHLADKIRNYWKQRGHKVRVWVADREQDRSQPIYGVRSNLVGGLPPK